MNIYEIYNQLFLGNILVISATDKKAAEALRVSLAKYKRTQDLAMHAFLEIEALPEWTSLTARWDAEKHTVTFQFVPKKKKGGKEYDVTIISEPDDGNSNSSIDESLGGVSET